MVSFIASFITKTSHNSELMVSAAALPESVAIRVPTVSYANEDEDRNSLAFVDNYHMDSSDVGSIEEEFTLSEKMVHYLGGRVVPEHWTACKATLVFFAGAHTSKLTVMNKVGKEVACLEAYKAAIGDLDSSHFCPEAIKFFSSSFKKKDEVMLAEPLYRYYLDSRNKMRSLIIPLFPATFASMKSGRGFHESCNDVFVKAYRRDLMRSKKVTTEEEAENELPPYLWEYKKNPWFLSLAVKIFRRDPQLAPDVSDVMLDKENVPVSRAALLRIKQEKAVAGVVLGRRNRNGYWNGTASDRGEDFGNNIVNDVETIKNKRKATWAKVHTARAMAVQSNVAQRLGRISELEKAIDILDRMRTVIGEAQYKAKVANVAANFPDFATFNSDVNVLVIDSSDNDNE